MPAFGIASSDGLTAPAGYMQEVSSETTCEVATIKDQNGQVVKAQAKPLRTKTVTVKTRGEADLTAVPDGVAFSGLTVTASRLSETQDDFPTSEVTGILYS